MTDQAAQLGLLLKQRDPVPPVAEIHSRLHAGGAAADHGDLLAGTGLLHQHVQPVLDTQFGIDGADGVIGIVWPPSMALVAAQTGHDVIRPALIDELAVIRVGYPGAGHGDQIQFALSQRLLTGIRIVPAAHRSDEHAGVFALDIGRSVQRRHLQRLIVGGMVAVGVAGPDLGNVHIGRRQLQELHHVVSGVAAVLVLLAGDQDLHDEVLTHGLADLLQDHEAETGAVLRAAAVLIGAVVGQRGEELRHDLGAVAHMDGGHIEAKELQDLALLGIGLGHLLHGLHIQLAHCIPGRLMIALKILRGGVEDGLHRTFNLCELQMALVHGVLLHQNGVLVAGHKEAHTGDGAIVVDGIGQLEQVILALGIIEVEIRKVGTVGIHGHMLVLVEVIDAHAGDDSRAGLGPVGIVGDNAVGGIGLRPL